MEWFKFYHNKWLTDRKILSLSVEDRLCFITLLCVVSRERDSASRASHFVTKGRDGTIYDYDEWQIIKLAQLDQDFANPENCPVQKSVGFTQRLIDIGLLEKGGDGEITVKNFGRLQDRALTDAERARLYRERKKGVDNDASRTVTERHESVTLDKEKDKEKIKNKRSSKSVSVSDEDTRLAQLLIDLIQQNNPDWQMRGSLETWAGHIEKLHRIDKRTYEQIEYMIRWTQQHDFWSSNILSTKKLREKFNDPLLAQLKRDLADKQKKNLQSNKPKFA